MTSTKFTARELEQFFQAYIESALWSSTDDNCIPLDAEYSIDDIDTETKTKMREDCKAFLEANWEHITDENCHYKGCPTIEYAGHDFWLTRCGHGAGFWDGDWKEPAATILTEASKKFGNVDLYVGDNGKIDC